MFRSGRGRRGKHVHSHHEQQQSQFHSSHGAAAAASASASASASGSVSSAAGWWVSGTGGASALSFSLSVAVQCSVVQCSAVQCDSSSSLFPSLFSPRWRMSWPGASLSLRRWSSPQPSSRCFFLCSPCTRRSQIRPHCTQPDAPRASDIYGLTSIRRRCASCRLQPIRTCCIRIRLSIARLHPWRVAPSELFRQAHLNSRARRRALFDRDAAFDAGRSRSHLPR